METRFGIVALVVQAVFVAAFAVFADYGDADPRMVGNASGTWLPGASGFGTAYPIYQNSHATIFIGFGLLATYLKWYGHSSVGLSLLLAALVLQWSLIVGGLFRLANMRFSVDLSALLSADFACAAVLISFGAVLGRTSPLQSLALAIVEVPLLMANEFVCQNKFAATDAGRSMYVHVFGAYFGLVTAKTLVSKTDSSNPSDAPSYTNDLFAAVGSLYLWTHWPSLNAALAGSDDARQRAAVNTTLALAGSTVAALAVSSLLSRGRFKMSHLQSCSLAGGVAVGTVADLLIQPWVAISIGAVAGGVSVFGFAVLSPLLRHRHFLDTRGVHNLHGLPGIIAGLCGVLFAALASFDDYGLSLYRIFPARAPPTTIVNASLSSGSRSLGVGRSAPLQAVFQAAALCMTLLFATLGGLVTGFLLKIEALDRLQMQNFYIDTQYWLAPDDLKATRHTEATHVADRQAKEATANEEIEAKEATEESSFLPEPADGEADTSV